MKRWDWPTCPRSQSYDFICYDHTDNEVFTVKLESLGVNFETIEAAGFFLIFFFFNICNPLKQQ